MIEVLAVSYVLSVSSFTFVALVRAAPRVMKDDPIEWNPTLRRQAVVLMACVLLSIPTLCGVTLVGILS